MGKTYYYEPSFANRQLRKKHIDFRRSFYCLFNEEERSYHHLVLKRGYRSYDEYEHWEYVYTSSPLFPEIHKIFQNKGVPSNKREEFFNLIKEQPPIVIAKIRMTVPGLTNAKRV